VDEIDVLDFVKISTSQISKVRRSATKSAAQPQVRVAFKPSNGLKPPRRLILCSLLLRPLVDARNAISPNLFVLSGVHPASEVAANAPATQPQPILQQRLSMQRTSNRGDSFQVRLSFS
jgi:hypothetical protein